MEEEVTMAVTRTNQHLVADISGKTLEEIQQLFAEAEAKGEVCVVSFTTELTRQQFIEKLDEANLREALRRSLQEEPEDDGLDEWGNPR